MTTTLSEVITVCDSKSNIIHNDVSQVDKYDSANEVATGIDGESGKHQQQVMTTDLNISINQENQPSLFSDCFLYHGERCYDEDNMIGSQMQSESVVLEESDTNNMLVNGLSDYGSPAILHDEDDCTEGHKVRNIIFSKSNKKNRIKEIANRNLDEQRRNEIQITAREDQLIRKMKLLFFFLLIIIAIIISYFVFRFVRNDEINEFNTQFRNYGQLITNKLHTNALSKIEAINTLAFYIQSYAIQSHLTWPYVTVPHFEDQVMAMRSLTDAYAVQIFPVVTNETRATWEEYSIKHNYWINESYRTQMGYFGGTNNRPILDESNTTWFDALWGEEYANPDMPDFEIANGTSNTIFVTYHPGNSSNWDPYIDPNPTGPYFPQWQAAPLSGYYQGTVNLNYGSYYDFNNCSTISMTTHEACLGKAWRDGETPGYITTMLYPIFDQFVYKYNIDLESTISQQNDDPRNVVAFLGVDINWESYLKQILPPTAKKLHVVVQSTCGHPFTLELIGENVTFLGDGDLHEPRYDNMYEKTRFGENLYKTALKERQQIENNAISSRSTYIGQPLYDKFCQYDFTVYPSKDLENNYFTTKPMVYTISVVALFAFTFIVFIGYDWLVEKRQRIVLKSAILSDSIVSSLFPTNVKHQLYYNRSANELEVNEKQQKDSSSSGVFDSTNPRLHPLGILNKVRLYSFGREPLPTSNALIGSAGDCLVCSSDKVNSYGNSRYDAGGGGDNNERNNGLKCNMALPIPSKTDPNDERLEATEKLAMRKSSRSSEKAASIGKNRNKVIAELYPDATVLFADIVGFTSWCSGREPSDVFLLLETIYGAFDEIAVRLKVFKVETIGDCYVAVTGLPEPQPDHAEIMVTFAHLMLNQLRIELQNTISPTLGSDSNQLALRVGLNSGAVIAGVLRGDRARFQLFGDTMNTAARMESSSERDRIHASQTTADVLAMKGKGHWLSARSDLIEAKGKGKLQTYWVTMGPPETTRSTISCSVLAFQSSVANSALPSTNPTTGSIIVNAEHYATNQSDPTKSVREGE